MAICKFGTTVVGVRGTVGGLTYSANGSGPHVRIWSKGSNPNSVLQAHTRSRITGLGTLWNALTDNQRAAWTYFGLHPPEVDTNSLAEVIHLSGWMWFVRVNQRRQSVGLPPTSTLPNAAAEPSMSGLTLSATALPAGNIWYGWGASWFQAGTSGVVMMAVHPTVGLLNKHSGFRQVWAEHEPAGGQVNLALPVTAAFGPVPAHWKLFASVSVLRDDGVRSAPLTLTCEVT